MKCQNCGEDVKKAVCGRFCSTRCACEYYDDNFDPPDPEADYEEWEEHEPEEHGDG